MHKMFVVLKREYLTRVKNKTFIVMTFLAPVLIAVFYAAVIFVATRDASDTKVRRILVSDESGFFTPLLDSLGNFKFELLKSNRDSALKAVQNGNAFAYMKISDADRSKIDSVEWISMQSLSLMQQEKLTAHLSSIVFKNKLSSLKLSKGFIDSLSPKARITAIEINDQGELKSSSTGLKSGIGMGLAIVIYMFIFIYGSMVMRSALEEKTNRIVEVIVSSIKPFQMMMGKIAGVALVGLTQFAAWILLSFVLIGVIGSFVAKTAMQKIPSSVPADMKNKAMEQVAGQLNDSFASALMNLPYAQIITVFLLFFLGGYLLYGSFFAAIGSAVNQETDVQQFMFPVSIPLVFGIVIAQSVVFQDPNGQIAKIFSMIPFTSPIVMVVRSPFGVSWGEIFLSFAILAVTFILMVWLAGKIYRVGILMYGKKPTWKELGKWLFVKD